MAGFLFLVYFKRWNHLILFGMTALLVCSIYTVHLWSETALNTYIYQIQHWPTHQEVFGEKIEGGIMGIVWNNFIRVLGEHKRYFWDQDVWGLSALFLISLIGRFKFLYTKHKPLLVYTLLLMFLTGLITSSHEARYLVYLMPFMILISALVIVSIKKHQTWSMKSILQALILIIFVGQFFLAGWAYKEIFRLNYDHSEKHSQILSKVDEGANILGPWELIYNEIDRYNIHSFKTYEYIEDQQNTVLSQLDILRMADERFGMDYIILDQKRKKAKDSWFGGWEITENPYYKSIYTNTDYLILKRQ